MWPILFKSDWLTLFSYPLLMGVAWGAAIRLYLYTLHRKQLATTVIPYYLTGLFVFAWLGAKILFWITAPAFEVASANFWLGGGFVFLGGLIAATLYSALFVWRIETYSLRHLEALLPSLCLGHAIGRIGCLLAGCCFGKETTSFLSVHLHGLWRHPVQLYESLGLFFLSFVIFKLLMRQKNILSWYLLGYGILRFSLEFLRGDAVRGLYWGISTSQYISVIMILLGFLLLVYQQKRT